MEIQTNVLNEDGTMTLQAVTAVVSSTTDEFGNPVKVIQIESPVPEAPAAPAEDPVPAE
jgi:hypothetical protein